MSPSSQPEPLLSVHLEGQRRYKEILLSRDWDVGNGREPRLKYAILATPRTGSEFLCASLCRRGVGVPLEYLGVFSIAERLGCRDDAGNTPLGPYFAQLHAKRTTPNGIFGLKVLSMQLRRFAGDDISAAADFLSSFDRVLLLRRKDKLLQAISWARAIQTRQFHGFAGDAEPALTQPDYLLFDQIATQLAAIVGEDRYAVRVLARVDPGKVKGVWYEQLSESVIDAIATWLSAGVERIDLARPPFVDHPVPHRGNIEEALALKRRFLAYLSGEPS
jgi:LPS sulfotransferase NodH